MVRGAGNVFFDISNFNFEILTGIPTYALFVTPAEQELCPPAAVNYMITVQSINGYNSPVTLSTTGHPPGSTVQFSVNPVIPGNMSQMSVTVPGGTSTGAYTIVINGSSAAGEKSASTQLEVDGVPLIPVLSFPGDGEQDIPLNSNLSWQTGIGADYYSVELATDPQFAEMVFEDTTSQRRRHMVGCA
jgi:hypothetical protein